MVGVAMEIEKRPDSDKIHVKVSNAIFRRHARKTYGPIEGMVTLGLRSFKRVDEDETLPEYIEDLADRVSKLAGPPPKSDEKTDNGSDGEDNDGRDDGKDDGKDDEKDDDEKDDGDNSSEDDSGDGRDDEAGGQKRKNEERRLGKNKKRKGENRRGAQDADVDSLSSLDKTEVFPSSMLSEESTTVTESRTWSCCTHEELHLTREEALNLPHKGLLGHGRSGIVHESQWNGYEVAVKLWNREEDEGLDDMINEIEVYKKIQSVAPELLGSVLPRLFCAYTPEEHCSSPTYSSSETAVLVTQLVGHTLMRDRTKKLCVEIDGSRLPVSAEDERKIYEQALRALRTLHANMFIHGDVALRNLRTEKMGDDWKIWWIDMGHSKKISPSLAKLRMKVERQDCSSIFWSRML